MTNLKKLPVAILGSGNIGTDLLVKVIRSSSLECRKFVGRNNTSQGILFAKRLNIPTSDRGIQEIVENPDCCELVFDATSARAHFEHAKVLYELKKYVIDMTPSRLGQIVVPAISIEETCQNKNVNMISCGGQASIPLAYVLGQAHEDVDYIEVVSSISSKSAGPATRLNLDEYIETTESGIKKFSKCNKAKAILIVNPAVPPINMQTTVSAKVSNPNLERVNRYLGSMIKKLTSYVPGYKVIVPPVYEKNRVVIMIRVTGLGDYLPSYAGNLDIINCAAIATAEVYANKYIKGDLRWDAE